MKCSEKIRTFIHIMNQKMLNNKTWQQLTLDADEIGSIFYFQVSQESGHVKILQCIHAHFYRKYNSEIF